MLFSLVYFIGLLYFLILFMLEYVFYLLFFIFFYFYEFLLGVSYSSKGENRDGGGVTNSSSLF